MLPVKMRFCRRSKFQWKVDDSGKKIPTVFLNRELFPTTASWFPGFIFWSTQKPGSTLWGQFWNLFFPTWPIHSYGRQKYKYFFAATKFFCGKNVSLIKFFYRSFLNIARSSLVHFFSPEFSNGLFSNLPAVSLSLSLSHSHTLVHTHTHLLSRMRTLARARTHMWQLLMERSFFLSRPGVWFTQTSNGKMGLKFKLLRLRDCNYN